MPSVNRKGVFETNSSSTHSITICYDGKIDDRIGVDADGVCRLSTGEFGWEYETYNDAASKAAYIATAVASQNEVWNPETKSYDPQDFTLTKNFELLQRVICKETGAKSIEIMKSGDGYHPYGYIDHQSFGCWDEACESEKNLRQFIFCRSSVLETDNDNH